MSTTVDNRVVEMRFDNKQFESATAQSMSTIDKLTQKLKFSGAAKGLADVDASAKKVDMSGLGSAVDTVSARFSALQIAGITALANITNSAVNAGKRMISALTIDPIKTGFQEYETQMGAIQTILANTQHEGTNLKQVNAALDELNLYADKTIYNFTEMTRNIGTFTAAGVKLDTSVSAIKGIANLAAISGSTSQQASTAMYQLSQALAAGRVSLMDWNSVVNAGMGGKVFQDALIRTAKQQGKNVDEMIKKYGSFRESLTKGEWLTTDVLTETLTQLSGAYSEADLIAQGYSEKQAKEIAKLADTAVSAATEVKTFTQLWDTLKEAAQSGWSQTWRLIVGDFEEAKKMLTGISQTIGGVIDRSSNARNEVLKSWKDLGGRTELIKGFTNIWESIINIVKPIKDAFKEIFPPMTGKKLLEFTKGFNKLTESFKLSDSSAEKLKETFKGLFSIVDFFRKILMVVAKVIGSLFTSGLVSGLLDVVLSVTSVIGQFFTVLNSGFSLNGLSGIFSGIADIFSGIISGITGFEGALSSIGNSVSDVVGVIWNAIKGIFSGIADNMGSVITALAGGGLFVTFKKILGLISSAKGVAEGGILGLIFGKKDGEDGPKKLGFLDNISEVLGSVKESLNAFTSGIKTTSLVAIAAAVGILANALDTLSTLKAVDIGKSLLAVGVMFTMLTTSFKSMNKAISLFPGKGVIKSSVALVIMAEAINILAKAMSTIAGLSFGGLVKGLVGIAGGMLILTKGLNAIDSVKIKITTIIAISVMVKAIKSMSESIAELGSMSWSEIGRGLTAMAGAFTILIGSLKILDRAGSFKSLAGSVGIVILAQSLGDIASALGKAGSLSWGEIGRGLTGIGVALTELATVSGLLGKLSGFSGILGAVAIAQSANALGGIAKALSEVGFMSWDEIKNGLAGLGNALVELAAVSGLLGKLAGLSGLVGATTLVVGAKALGDIAKSFTVFAGMEWSQIKMGLAGMGGALMELAGITGLLGKLAGLSGLIGSGAILIAVQGLNKIANAFKSFGAMTWDQVKIGLVGMGGALAEIAGISGGLGKLAGLSGLFGAGAIAIACKGLIGLSMSFRQFATLSWAEIGRGLAGMGGALAEVALISAGLGKFAGLASLIGSGSIALVCNGLEELANSFKTFASMSWEEVKNGLKAMGGALGELALGSVLNTLSFLGSFSISTVAEPLGQLATSVKKWSGVTVPKGLGDQLGKLSEGVKKFTFGGLGASSIAAVASPLGTLANSVKKWAGVSVPENLKSQLSGLADGVKSFTWAFMGAISIDTIAKPLGTLATSVKKWTGVAVPDNLKSQLTRLADGVKAFNWTGLGGWSIGKVANPLGTLAASVKKWNGVNVPKNLGKRLEDLAGSIKKFSGVGNVTKGINAVSSITKSLTKLSGVKFGSVASGLKKFSESITNLGSASSSLKGVGSSISKNIITPINEIAPKASKAGSKIASSLAKGLRKTGSVKSAASVLSKAAINGLNSNSKPFSRAGTKFAESFAKSLKSKSNSVKTAASSLSKSAKSGVTKNGSSFKTAGKNLGQGLINGINAKKTAAYNAGYALGKKSAQGVKDGAKEKSPSKLTTQYGMWLGEGLIVGMDKVTTKVYSSGKALGKGTANAISNAINKVGNLLSSDMDTQPTISPVLDLSSIKSGVGTINSMLGQEVMVGANANISAINFGMANRNQNGVTGEIVSAIDKLRKDLGSMQGNTYNIDGVTYDDGTNISNAVQDIVRAAKVERRR